MELTNEMKEWLDERADDMRENGSLIFLNFVEKFTKAGTETEKNHAKYLIRIWDAERRGITTARARKLPDEGRGREN